MTKYIDMAGLPDDQRTASAMRLYADCSDYWLAAIGADAIDLCWSGYEDYVYQVAPGDEFDTSWKLSTYLPESGNVQVSLIEVRVSQVHIMYDEERDHYGQPVAAGSPVAV